MEAHKDKCIHRRSCMGFEKQVSDRRRAMIEKVLALGLIIIVLGPFGMTEPAAANSNLSLHKIKVMTQNLYIGADIFAPLNGPIGELPIRVAKTFAQVMQSNFPARAEALAEIIARNQPDFIGLQEVFLFRQSPSDFSTNPYPNAEGKVENGDYLKILLEKLGERGLHYIVAASVEDTDVELPMFVGLDGETPLLDDLRVTDHDVILVRDGIETSNPSPQNYPEYISLQFPFDLDGDGEPDLTIVSRRGFVSVDALVRGELFHIANTHLEVRGKDLFPPEDPRSLSASFYQAAQAQFLIASLAYETLPVIVVGDLNSDPRDPIIPASETDLGFPIIPPYKQFRLNLYRDVWLTNLLGFLNRKGFTCCQDENLQNEESALSERIDLMFVRNMPGSLPFSIVGPVFAVVVGDKEHEKTNTFPPLWPSDHGGIAAVMFIPTF
jgi:hypothetical protein